VDGTIEVRPDERLDAAAVERYVRARLPAIPEGAFQVRQFAAGHSNLTYLLRRGEWEAVLRRPPLGPVAPRAHDVAREGRLLERLSPVFPLAPTPILLCEDTAVIGAPFYLMERRHGLVVDRCLPADWPEDPVRNWRIGSALVSTLARLHDVDWQAAGLGALGRPEGYLGRQVEGWLGRWERARTHPDTPATERLAAHLRDALPPSPAPTVVHNDFKLNNTLLDPADPTRLVAVLDWEMATVGDPLSDLATTLVYWTQPDDPEHLRGMLSATATPGFPSRREAAELYARLSGRDLAHLDFYLAFAYFKVGVILQQIHYRWHVGQTRDPRFARLGQTADALVAEAARLLGAAR
jgi:aminoglycoside phosphotransferase (APT) family kinase protein